MATTGHSFSDWLISETYSPLKTPC
jgi:hypothetical protein